MKFITNPTTSHTVEVIPAGMFCGGEEIPAGTFHGGEEIPAGTFHSGMVQCPRCKHWFAADSYAWRTHTC